MQRLSSEDAWFFYAEGPTTPLHVTGLLLLDPSTAPAGFGIDQLRSHVRGRIHLMAQLRRRLVEVPFGIDHPSWVEDPGFDLDQHVVHHVLEDATDADLARHVGEFAALPLDRTRPLWQMDLVEGLVGGRAAVAMKLHHSIVDGVSGMGMVADLLDLTPEGATTPAAPDEWEPESVPGPLQSLAGASVHRLTTPLRPIRAAAGTAASLAGMAQTGLRRRLGGADAIAHPLGAPRTRFNSSLSGRRSVAFGSVSLAEVKDVRRHFGVTVNEVVLAACAHGLRCWLEEFDDLPDKPLVCSVPVSVHSAEPGDTTNQLSTMFVGLPVQLDDPIRRLEAVHTASEGAKEMQSAVGARLIGDVVEILPSTLLSAMVGLYSRTNLVERIAPVHNLIVSNVRGYPGALYLAGAEIRAMYPFGPLMEGTGLNVTVLSHHDDLDVGIIACPDVLPEVDRLLEGILEGVEVLRGAARAG
jgi:diacylglycerol O-acyltransferase / wax synthase